MLQLTHLRASTMMPPHPTASRMKKALVFGSKNTPKFGSYISSIEPSSRSRSPSPCPPPAPGPADTDSRARSTFDNECPAPPLPPPRAPLKNPFVSESWSSTCTLSDLSSSLVYTLRPQVYAHCTITAELTLVKRSPKDWPILAVPAAERGCPPKPGPRRLPQFPLCPTPRGPQAHQLHWLPGRQPSCLLPLLAERLMQRTLARFPRVLLVRCCVCVRMCARACVRACVYVCV